MTKNDQMSSFGLYLQTLRVEKGISIEQVAAETRIRAEILRSIEAEDHANLPDDVFLKGFLRSFATVVGADPNEVLRRFDIRRKVQAPARVVPGAETTRQGRFWLTLLWVAVLMACLVGGTFLGYEMVLQRGMETAPQAPLADVKETAAPDETPAASAAAVPEAPPEEDAVEVQDAAEPPRYVLEIACDEDTWLKIIVDDAPAEEYTLKPGDTLRLTASSNYNLLIGNAGGVSVQLDGHPVPVSGESGQVVNLQLP